MAITAGMVKELRAKTGAGMMDCKKALSENGGDLEKASDWLRTKGIAKAGKKSGRLAAEGLVHSYVHGGRVGVLVEVNSETDFVARNEGFQKFVADIAMHIAASTPQFVSTDEITNAVKEKERKALVAKALEDGKKEEFLEKIIEGQMSKWAASICLLDQKYVKNPDITVGHYLKETIASIGENIVIRRFALFELGEGLEKKSENFADEVAAQMKG